MRQNPLQADSFEEGEQIGIAKGREEEKQSMARGMLQEGMNMEVVSRITGLSVEDLGALS